MRKIVEQSVPIEDLAKLNISFAEDTAMFNHILYLINNQVQLVTKGGIPFTLHGFSCSDEPIESVRKFQFEVEIDESAVEEDFAILTVI